MPETRFEKPGVALIIFILVLLLPQVCLSEDVFLTWLNDLKTEAMTKGISGSTLDTAFAGLQPIQRVIELDRNQPEFTKDFQRYMKLTVTESRIKRGQWLLVKHRVLLDTIRDEYGVQPRFLVAIWGLETNFGRNTGTFPIIGAVATLAYDTRRSRFFRAELLNALKILDEGHITISEMLGSWAGAMGQVQFMPSSFVRFAVDEDKDGRKDIWHSLPDVFASAANFLSSNGWDPDFIWGREGTLPPGWNGDIAGLDTKKPLAAWQHIGIRRANGEDLPDADIPASLIQPSGSNGPSFLVYRNYRAIMRWNPSHLYALAVCRLADRLAGLE